MSDKLPITTKPCPDCPDGYVWTASGPTEKECPTCLGLSFVYVGTTQEKGKAHIEARYAIPQEPKASEQP